ncbi:hypothetical protein FHS43_000765 [Streptosporangium becharense]|uniref:Uncharacterized protein n=1 Tax=Streptosporangium becharense TaxID=1816182 RepID=A0A7W9MGK7_9ACTN|nr:hypothetical protein [Streptosporangium becharense]MBB2909519.1 hypothetical protein [Streptosporangium becharense]MBB5819524.1 hypothetical protein [Streptosporangium becharense]
MDRSNHWYGHSRVFARYCGIDEREVPRIRGFVQHGWNYLHGFPPDDHWCVPGYPRFVWSDVLRRRGWSMGRRGHCVIGSPWAYLLAMEPRPGRVPEPERAGTIWYPFHGWEKAAVHGDHAALVDEIRNVEPGPVTVCLYWLEYRDPVVRGWYERAGFRVICHGDRGSRWDLRGRDFLRRQLAELRRHRRVASNRLGSALFYGASVGCDVAVYGDPMQLENERPEYGGTARRMRLWPELHGVEVDRAAAAEAARLELGFDHLRGPAELRHLFGWSEEEPAERPGRNPAKGRAKGPVEGPGRSPVEGPVEGRAKGAVRGTAKGTRCG